MADSRRTRDYQPDVLPEDHPLLPYLNDPQVSMQDQVGLNLGGAGNDSFSNQPAMGDVEGRVGTIENLGDQRRILEDGIARLRGMPDSRAMTLGEMWQGAKDAGSAGLGMLGRGLDAITPSQGTIDNIAMRFQNAHAIGTGQTPLYMMQQQHMANMQNAQDMMAMRRSQLADQLGKLQQAQQMHMQDQALKVWGDHQMPIAMKKKISQQLASQGNTLAGNLARLGDEQLVAEMGTLAPFLPKGKMEELQQMMTQPNADLDHVEQWLGFARDKKKVAGEQRMKSERFADLLGQYNQGGMDPMSPEYDEFKQMVGEREKRQQEAAEMKLKLEQLGLSKRKAEQELAASSVMPQYGPEVNLPNGNVSRDKFDPQTGQLSQITGSKPPASQVNIDMKQESAFEKKLGDKNAERVDDTRVKATDAAAIIQNAHQGKQLLDSGMITGVGAEYLTKFGQALQQVGFMKGRDAISNTQAFAANMAGNVAKQIKEFGAGTGLSDADREYATKMAGGDITLDEKSIRKILDINEKAARNIIKKHNTSVKGIKSVIPLTVDEPGEYTPQGKQVGKPSLDDLLKKYGGK